ncbi:Tfp pilus assembly protein FimT/FimU [Pelomonas sp. KK5]|uniref:pilus assembly FimT family protein n=1 Tax=Pelomonas sp. KK5 TaxID=1855730 RepID=UPI00097C25D0|nr:GspH/FimT family pseudopilin [Pelomonas sp. KK5]
MLNRSRQRGVNLVEVMVVLIVLGLVLSRLMPYVADWLTSIKMRNVAESLRGGIERARNESLRRNGNVTFWLVSDTTSSVPGSSCSVSSSSSQWVVSVGNPAGQCNAVASLTDAPQLAFRSQAGESSSAVSISAQSSGANAANHVTFNGLGQVIADGADPIQTIDVTLAAGGGRRLRVVVEAGGSVRNCDPDVAAGDPRVCPTL